MVPAPRGYPPGDPKAEKEPVTQAPSSARQDEYLGEHHVYEPHRAGLPPLVPYVRELWRRHGLIGVTEVPAALRRDRPR